MTGILDALACVGSPVGCGINWLDSLPVLAVIAVSIAIGAIIGAHVGKVVVYSILTLGVVALFLDKRKADDEHEMVFTHPDKPVKRKGKTLAQRAIEGE